MSETDGAARRPYHFDLTGRRHDVGSPWAGSGPTCLIAASLRNDDRNQDGRATLKTNEKKNKLKAEHGIVCSKPHDRFGYFGWPTVARMDDGELVVASSGLRTW